MTYILGISSFYHDSAVALINNGNIINAVQEERFTRIKHDDAFPVNSIKWILKENSIDLSKIDYFVFYDKPFVKFDRLVETYLDQSPLGFKSFKLAIPLWLKEKLFLKRLITKTFKKHFNDFNEDKLMFSEHHLSHAASAFYPSPFEKAIILTLDGVGEWVTSSVAIGDGNNIEIKKEIKFPNSLGLLYSAFTYYLGFKVNSGEYKVMGLAPYGKPIYKKIILEKIVDVKSDGSFRLNQEYFDYMVGLKMINSNFENLFDMKRRDPLKEKLEQFHMDIASSIQATIEDIVLKMTESLRKEFNIDYLCLSGGVALNCVINGKIHKKGFFKDIWIQPASGDAGGALGAALQLWHSELNNKRNIDKKGFDKMNGSFLGPSFNSLEIETELKKCKAVYSKLDEKNLNEIVVEGLIKDKAIGWFSGKMEFGPRALGSRSVIANPRSSDVQKKLNLKIKFRESFRPFAPAILEDKVTEWFNLKGKSPYMLFVSDVQKSKMIPMTDKEKNLFGIDKLNIKRSEIPAVTHVDYSARIQTVSKKFNTKFYNLIQCFYEKTKCPILVNTSFNVRGEPIVCSPKDAFNCFMGTNLDILVIENFILFKDKQKVKPNLGFSSRFDLD
jgi:carbamoyltransferase